MTEGKGRSIRVNIGYKFRANQKIVDVKTMLLISVSLIVLLSYLPSTTVSVAATTATNSAYSGYEVTGPFTSLRVKGSWIVPTADCSKTPNSVSNISVAFDAINGEGDGFMIGTFQDCNHGVASYGAFLIIYPFTSFTGNHSSINKIVIHPGDVIEAQGTFRVGAKPTDWNTNFVDQTTCTQLDIDARVSTTFTPKQDSGAVVLSSDGHTLTAFSTIQSGEQYTAGHCAGKQPATGSDIVGPSHEQITFGKMGAMPGYTLAELEIPSTTVTALTHGGSSFTITY
jgi:hypothetical protein